LILIVALKNRFGWAEDELDKFLIREAVGIHRDMSERGTGEVKTRCPVSPGNVQSGGKAEMAFRQRAITPPYIADIFKRENRFSQNERGDGKKTCEKERQDEY
jgi:hypothetical protein